MTLHAPSFTRDVSYRRETLPQDLFDPSIFHSLNDASQIVSQELSINEALPNLYHHDATALLIDANNFYLRAKSYGLTINYDRLKHIFESRCQLRYCTMFSAINHRDPNDLAWARRIESYGYTLMSKDLKIYHDPHDDDIVIAKGNMDVEITMAATALSDEFKHIVIATCDGDFQPLVEGLRKSRNCLVSVLGIKGDDWVGMSRGLVSSADCFYNLMDMPDVFDRRAQ